MTPPLSWYEVIKLLVEAAIEFAESRTQQKAQRAAGEAAARDDLAAVGRKPIP